MAGHPGGSGRQASSVSLTLRARTAGVKGFCMKSVPGSRRSWFAMATSMYPEVYSTFVPGYISLR